MHQACVLGGVDYGACSAPITVGYCADPIRPTGVPLPSSPMRVVERMRSDPEDGGWFFDADPLIAIPTSLTLCPVTCNALKADATAQISIVQGCMTNTMEPSLPPK